MMPLYQPVRAGGGSSSPLPTYEAATSRDPIVCIAPYLRREDLFNCALVCRAWRRALDDELWGEPALCFGFGEKSPLTSFLLFLRALPLVHPARRSCVHTLSLEQCIAGLYTTLPERWFSDLLRLLPGLQRLLAPSLPFLDHRSLLADASMPAHYSLHHLDISGLTNTTAKSLVSLLERTPALAVLDLSRTAGAGHADVLRAIGRSLQMLKSLKLRSLRLTDEAVGVLARGVQVRLERLDVTGNLLTDGVAAHLLDWCFMPPEFAVAVNSEMHAQQLPAAHDSDDESDAEFGDEEAWMTARTLRRREPVASAATMNLAPADKGLTHLHIAENRITARGVQQLLCSTRLRTLDCGAVYTPPTSTLHATMNTLVTSLTQYGFRKLRNLRIDRAAVLGARDTDIPAAELLDPQRLPRLKTLALTDVPAATTDALFIASLRGLLDGLTAPSGTSSLKMLVLEIVSAADSTSFCADVDTDTRTFFDRANDDFSFFADEKSRPVAATSSSRNHSIEEVEVATVDVVQKWREASRRQGRWWSGAVRIMQDIGGAEVSERGATGNRWGVLVSDVGL
ncbi:hypothetical protein TWF696_005174 [Orbilia brochopaga]|uniref:F-box domain-containing protein n=1 Tax=Orbilia brochopaga TaxID=3140254 RepID=A0AAV9V3U4_9PEZI